MRIGYLVNHYPKVSHTFIRREIHALEARGLEVVRYSLRRVSEPLADPLDHAEAERTRIVLDVGATGLAAALAREAAQRPAKFATASALAARIGYGSERGLAVHGAYLGEACVLRGWMERDGVEHVHAHFGTNPAAVAMLTHVLGGPSYSFVAHGPEEFDKPQAIALRQKIERARFVCAISSFGRSQLYRWAAPEAWSKVHVVRCGIEEAFRERQPPPPDAPRLVSVGRLNEQKGQLLLIEALARVAAHGVDFELTLVGDGELRSAVEEAAQRHGIADRVHITGWASGELVREAIVRSRALVLPSFAEGLPVVIMEAYGLGRPVLATYVGGIPELVEPGRSGWLVPAGDVDATAQALREVLAAPIEELARRAEIGRRAVLERHDVRVTAGVLADLFARYAERSPSRTRQAREIVGHVARANPRPNASPSGRGDRSASR